MTHGTLDNHDKNPTLTGAVADWPLTGWSTARVTKGAYTRDGGEKGKERLSLEGESEVWPQTQWSMACAAEAVGRSQSEAAVEMGYKPTLCDQAVIWPETQFPTPNTPGEGGRTHKVETAEQHHRTGKRKSGKKAQLQLESAVRLFPSHGGWSTPDANAIGDGCNLTPEEYIARLTQLKADYGNGNGAGVPLAVQANLWATATCRDWKDGACQSSAVGTDCLPSRQSVRWLDFIPPDPDGGSVPTVMTAASFDSLLTRMQAAGATYLVMPRGSRRRLNVIFVAWLMGWPASVLDDSVCWVTGWFPHRRHWHSLLSQLFSV